MKTKKLNTTIIVLIVALNLTASVMIIANGIKTIHNQKTPQLNSKAQNFIPSLIF